MPKYSLKLIKKYLLEADSLGDAVYFLESRLPELKEKKSKKKSKKLVKKVSHSSVNTGQVNKNVWTTEDQDRCKHDYQINEDTYCQCIICGLLYDDDECMK